MGGVQSPLQGALRPLGIALPFLVSIPAWLLLVRELRARRVKRAIGLMLAWAAILGICSTLLSYLRPELASAWFVNADAYWQEMSAWVQTGSGREADPSQFIPQHLLHLASFVALSLVSGSALSLAMGAALMHYMGAYVGRMAAQSSSPVFTMVVAWHPWALLRIVCFIILGVLLAQPLLARLFGFRVSWREHRHLFIVAGVGLVLDVVLKWLFAETWRQILLAL